MEKRKVDIDKLELTEFIPNWISDGDILNLDADTRRIIYFFVAETPCKNQSARGKRLSQYGWENDNPPKDGNFEEGLFEIAGLTKENLFLELKREKMKERFNETGMTGAFYEKLGGNFIVAFVDGNRVLEIFRHIRNAIAHLRFDIRNTELGTFFIFEDGSKNGKKFEVKARMILKKETLLKWIEWIKTGTEEVKKQTQEMDNKILEFVKNNSAQSMGEISEKIKCKENKVRSAIKRLKEQNKIEYRNRKWNVIELKEAS